MSSPMRRFTFELNGRRVAVEVSDPGEPLLYVIRNRFGLHGPQFGCGLGQCGACAVVVNGTAIRSCVTPVSAAQGARVVTLEGLGSAANPHPLQRAFVAEQAAQCGYCINGMIMTAKALLDRTPHPSDTEIKRALAGNLCRCGTHLRIIRAIKRAVEARRT